MTGKRIWVDSTNHIGSMVCYGIEKDHLVLSPVAAQRLGEEFIKAAELAAKDNEKLFSKKEDASESSQ